MVAGGPYDPGTHGGMVRQSRKWRACRYCKRTRTECGHLSLRGLCFSCMAQAMAANAHAMVDRRGPQYEAYLRGLRRYVERSTEELHLH